MSVDEITQPNAKSNELENKRKESLNSFIKEKRYGKKSDDGDGEGSDDQKSQENSDNSDKKLDNDQNNSYINNKDEDSAKDTQTSDNDEQPEGDDEDVVDESTDKETLDEYEKVLKDTFGGDPRKAVKSWKESQKNYTKLRKEKKEKEEQIKYINNLVEQNPMLGDIIKTAAEKGNLSKDDLQNFLSEGQQEPSGKPKTSSSESKLDIVDEGFELDDIDESTLAEAGYLDQSRKDMLSSSEWSNLKRRAKLQYAEDKLPQRLASKAYEQFQRQIDEAKEKQKQEKRRERVQQKNAERYEQGMERVVDEFDLDFAGNEEHEELLDEIESVAVNIRDPQDDAMIHPNAMYLATLQVMEDKGMNPKPATDVDKEVEKAKQNADESFDKRTGFNANTKQAGGDDKPQTAAEKLRQRNLQRYKDEQDKRRKTGRIPGSDN